MTHIIQTLRCIDKADKIGIPAVIELLQKPIHEFGAELNPIQAGMIGLFLTSTGADNAETLKNLNELLAVRLPRIRARVELLIEMERGGEDGLETALDRLLALPENENNSWEGGGRPKNIGWALDDIIEQFCGER